MNKSDKTFKPITATFLDGICCDIPSQNWGPSEWARQFDVFRDMGMDSVMIIRVGWSFMSMFKSKVLKTDVYDADDRVALFLDEARRTGLRLYMGMHDTYKCWRQFDWEGEVSINIELIDELMERYGKHPAFYGWYVSHEPGLDSLPWNIWNPLIAKIRKVSPRKPVLLSPRFEGRKWDPDNPRPPKSYAHMFDDAMSHMTQKIDAAAFMDGHPAFGELREYVSLMKPVMDKHGIAYWSNLETFDRDMPIRFPPIDWNKMRMKLELVQPYVSKVMTFEAPHFLSPYSMWESGRMLYRRYMEYLDKKRR